MPKHLLKQALVIFFTDGAIRGSPSDHRKPISVPEAIQRDLYTFLEFTTNRAMNLFLENNSNILCYSSVKRACAKHYSRGGTPVQHQDDKRPIIIKLLGLWFHDQPTGWKFPIDIQAKLIQRNLKTLNGHGNFVVFSWSNPTKVLREFQVVCKAVLAGKTYSEPDAVIQEHIRVFGDLLRLLGTNFYDPQIFKEQKHKVLAYIYPDPPQEERDVSYASSGYTPESETRFVDWSTELEGGHIGPTGSSRNPRPITPQRISLEYLPELHCDGEREGAELEIMRSVGLVGQTEAFGGGADLNVHVERRRADNSLRQSLSGTMPW